MRRDRAARVGECQEPLEYDLCCFGCEAEVGWTVCPSHLDMGISQQPRTILTAQLIVLDFFFLLRVGEYTHSWDNRRTIPLRKKDIQLWQAGTILPNDSPLDVLTSADLVTVCLENQKNGRKNK
jgi:hypothetical protein